MLHFGMILLYITLFTKTILCQSMTTEDLNDLRIELREEFDASGKLKPFLATTVRLAFHDCSGPQELNGNLISRCNGCVDLDNHDHAGLREGAVTELSHIYNASGWNQKMSRADFWITAATMALEYAHELDTNSNDILPSIPYYFGRIDCGDTPDAIKTKGFPRPSWGWNNVQQWFSEQLGYNDREAVAILGAHTLGRCHLHFSGYSDLSWVPRSDGPHILNNKFYIRLLNENWSQSQASDGGLWEYKDPASSMLMLNTDMSMRYGLDGHFDINSVNGGRVICETDITRNASNQCPTNNKTIDIVTDYANSNQLWLNDFVAIWNKLIVTGYNDGELNVLDELRATTDNPIDTTLATSETTPTMAASTIATDNTNGATITTQDTTTSNGDGTTATITTVNGGNETVTTISVAEEAKEEILETLNEYSGILALIAIIGVILIFGILLIQMFCTLCCNANKNHQEAIPVLDNV